MLCISFWVFKASLFWLDSDLDSDSETYVILENFPTVCFLKTKASFLWFSRTNAISMFNFREVGQWLGLNIVEIWVNLVSLTVFSVLLVLKLDEVVLHLTPEGNSLKSLLPLLSVAAETPEQILYDLTWWQVFSPLFFSDALNCYFCTIVWIRMYLEGANGKISRFVILILSIGRLKNYSIWNICLDWFCS